MAEKKNNLGKKYRKTLFITGGAGFIGSNYLNKFVRKYPNYLFVNIDCLTYAADLKNLSVSALPNYRFRKIDIRNLPRLEAVFKEFSPDGVINFSAESHVDFSI